MPRRIYITGPDRLKLMKLIDEQADDIRGKEYIRDLYKDLMHADIVSANRLSPAAVTMNSQALLSLDGDEEEIRLVHPESADALKGMISIFSPLGASIYGYREGDAFECGAIGVKRLEIKGVYNARPPKA